MPGFAESFWTPDYAGGMGVLFGKLQQGVAENTQLLTIARMRAEAEDSYGMRLGEIGRETDKIKGGFSRDDGASIRKAYDGVRTEMDEASKIHRKIATGIRDLVVNPFSRWCDAHETRVQNSHDELQSRLKLHDKQADTVQKLRSHYLNKCRLVEDIEEENKLAFQDPMSAASETSPKPKIPEIKEPGPPKQESDDEDPMEIGDEVYSLDQVKTILAHMLTNVKLGETKVPILGTYSNVSTGADIVEYLQQNVGATSVSHAERIGQDLVTLGFLRLVGNVGNTFANSSKLFYQWRPKVFTMTGIPDKKQVLNRTFSLGSNADFAESPVVGSLSEYLASFNILNSQHPNETPGDRLRREAAESDARYKAGVRKLDILRCQLEEAMVEHFKFMERCELDRLKAIKTVVLDFAGTIGNKIPTMQSTVDKMMLFQETVQPEGDLRYLLENYRTGSYAPKVTVYDNYYNSGDEQTFGVDLEARARADKKRVPIIVTAILTYLDQHYPDLEGDEARQTVWTVDVPLSATHHLRNVINDGKPVDFAILKNYEIPIVASVLKLYLLELPDSLVSFHVYDIVKTIYTGPVSESTDEARISVLQNTLSQLRLANIATLDALMTHFTRLLELTSADEKYMSTLAHILAPTILRPRLENVLTMEEKHPYRLIRDLFTYKTQIFTELKRASSLAHNGSVSKDNRPRAISSDESNRRAHMEARQKAIAEKSVVTSRGRATSPAPSPRHRRDRSVGGPETRFPIASPTNPTHGHRSTNTTGTSSSGSRPSSLEVPGESVIQNMNPVLTSQPLQAITNGSGEHSPVQPISAIDGVIESENSGLEKRNSLGRSSPVTRYTGNRKSGGLARQSLHLDRKRDSVGSLHQVEGMERANVGVSLTDKPMDD